MSQKPSYFLTAYGIALKHGFKGTEEEWLNSLTAFYLAQQAGYSGTVEEWLQALNDPVPDFEIGTVETLDGGSKAYVKQGGNRHHVVLNFGIPRGIGMADALPILGGKMKGPVDMDGYGLTGLPEAKNGGDAVSKQVLDAAVRSVQSLFEKADAKLLSKSGGTMTGSIHMGGHMLQGLSTPVSWDQAVNKQYVDEMEKLIGQGVKKVTFTLTVPAASWSGTQPPYSQTLSLSGILETDSPYFGPAYSGADLLEQKQAFACIDVLETRNGSVILTCLENKPGRDVTLRMEVFR